MLYRSCLIGNRLTSVVSLPRHWKPAGEYCIAAALSETGWRVLYRRRVIGNRLASVVSPPRYRKPAGEYCIAAASSETGQRGLYRRRVIGNRAARVVSLPRIHKKKGEWRITTWEAPRAGKALRISYSRSWIIDRRSLCSGRIHYKITLVLYLQVGQMLSLIELNRTMFCMRGCLIHDLPHISTEHLRSLGT